MMKIAYFNKESCACLVKKMRLSPGKLAVAAAILLFPLVLNWMIWKGMLTAGEERLQALHQIDSLYRLKPKMELLLSENDRLMQGFDYTRYWHEDAASALKKIRELAALHDLEIEEIALKDQNTNAQKGIVLEPRFVRMDANLQILGTFEQITKWIHELEKRPGFQIENWQVRYDTVSGSCRLYMDLNMVMGQL